MNLHRYSCKLPVTLYSRQILVKHEYSRQFFEKSYIKFHENLSSGSRIQCGQTAGWSDGQADTQA
jgi:hypothetical protein